MSGVEPVWRCYDYLVLWWPQAEWWWLFKVSAADVVASKSIAAWQWSNYIIPTFSPLITTLQKTKFCNTWFLLQLTNPNVFPMKFKQIFSQWFCKQVRKLISWCAKFHIDFIVVYQFMNKMIPCINMFASFVKDMICW